MLSQRKNATFSVFLIGAVFLQMSGAAVIQSDLEECEAGEVRCDTGDDCVELSQQCDGRPHCKDGSDEKKSLCSSPDYNCGEDRFRCDSGDQCIETYDLCNGRIECKDGSDETNKTCTSGIVSDHRNWCSGLWTRCDNMECVSIFWLCDGENHCDDGSDEKNCEKPCGRNGHLCADKKYCINKMSLCDGRKDCSDNSDEDVNFCAARVCPPDHFKCRSPRGQCVPQPLVCDGAQDCKDGSDEDCSSVVLALWKWGESVFGLGD